MVDKTPDFEKSFGEFLDRQEYDQAKNALFSIMRISYKAGWLAAGGLPIGQHQVLELMHPTRVRPLENHLDSIVMNIGIPENAEDT